MKRFILLFALLSPLAGGRKSRFAGLLLCAVLFALYSSISIAAVRYVSHSGNNTPPYLSWETAADSIMSAKKYSHFL